MPKTRISTALLIGILLSATSAQADTLHLKNGKTIDGIVESETPDAVSLNLGFGVMTFRRDEIDRIDRSAPEDQAALRSEWDKASEDSKKHWSEAEQARQKRLDSAAALREEGEAKKREADEYAPKRIAVRAQNGQIIVNVLLNGHVRATLLLDSGASIVQLSNRLVKRLDLDLTQAQKGSIQVADGRSSEALFFALDSLKVQDTGETGAGAGVEADGIKACILPEGVDAVVRESGNAPAFLVDGLLGMSFLENFKFNADYKNSILTFQKIQPEPPPS